MVQVLIKISMSRYSQYFLDDQMCVAKKSAYSAYSLCVQYNC